MIQEARKLSLDELRALTAQLEEEVAERTDKQFEDNVRSGALDHLAQEACREFQTGATRPLHEILDGERLP
ncbi:MAG: hypothetical protein ACC661_05580 [Verrucomicrobiales bacterium]